MSLHRMDAGDLLKDELEFELACRGVFNILTVAPMRKILREMLNREKEGLSSYEMSAPAAYSNEPTSEIEQCLGKLKALSQAVTEMSEAPESVILKRITSRLLHLQNRANCIRPTGEDVLRHTKLCEDIIILLDQTFKLGTADQNLGTLSDADKEILQQSLGPEALLIITKLELEEEDKRKHDGEGQHGRDERGKTPPTGYEDDLEQPYDRNSRHQRTPPPPPCGNKLVRSSTLDKEFMNRKLVPIKDWGVKFSGKGGTSINAFLERVEELKDARNAVEDDLWRYAIDFFDGEALIWFRANKDYVNNWKELKKLLLLTFQSHYYQDQLLEEIKRRTQGREENVTIYVSVMQNMFNRLPESLSESQKISILLKNIQPYYQQAVCRDQFYSVSELTSVLGIIERTKTNCDQFREPGMSVNTLEPDLAYKGSSGEEVNSFQQRYSRKEFAENLPRNTEMKCWNCRATGHAFRACKLPRQRIFCYRCGKFGQTTEKCSHCSRSGNGKEEGGSTTERLPSQ